MLNGEFSMIMINGSSWLDVIKWKAQTLLQALRFKPVLTDLTTAIKNKIYTHNMSKSVQISTDLKQQSPEKNREEKLMDEVLILVKTLVYEEESTIKLIIDCLYDVGATNLINQRFQIGTVNKTLKFMTKISKPAFKILAWHWFKNNCPNLITGWLQSKVAFPPRVETAKIEVMVDNETTDIAYSSQLPERNQIEQVKHLNFQVQLLIGLLAVVLTMFSGSFIWLSYSLQQSHLQAGEKLQNQVKTLESNRN
jgi:hypothetical protein